MKVTLHSHHTSSLLLSNEVRSTPWSDNIWGTSDLRWIQQSHKTEREVSSPIHGTVCQRQWQYGLNFPVQNFY